VLLNSAVSQPNRHNIWCRTANYGMRTCVFKSCRVLSLTHWVWFNLLNIHIQSSSVPGHSIHVRIIFCSCSCCRSFQPVNFVIIGKYDSILSRHSFTIFNIIWTIPCLHLAASARPDLCRFVAERPRPVDKWLTAHLIFATRKVETLHVIFSFRATILINLNLNLESGVL